MVQGFDGDVRQVTEEDTRKVESFWDDPRNILHLIDLIFFYEENKEQIPS